MQASGESVSPAQTGQCRGTMLTAAGYALSIGGAGVTLSGAHAQRVKPSVLSLWRHGPLELLMVFTDKYPQCQGLHRPWSTRKRMNHHEKKPERCTCALCCPGCVGGRLKVNPGADQKEHSDTQAVSGPGEQAAEGSRRVCGEGHGHASFPFTWRYLRPGFRDLSTYTCPPGVGGISLVALEATKGHTCRCSEDSTCQRSNPGP